MGRSCSCLLLLALAALPGCGGAEEYDWGLPEGYPTPRVPEDNPMSVAKVELGRALFFDTRLSANQTQSCASCHDPDLAFTDGLPVSVGSTGELTARSAMSLVNVGYAPTLNWANPTVVRLEAQALIPMFGETPVELGMSGKEDLLLERLAEDPELVAMFEESFPGDGEPVTLDHVVKAIAAFERSLVSFDSAYDRYVGGDESAMSESARRGMELFFSEQMECFHCHGGFNFTAAVDFEGNAFDQSSFQNNGLYNVDGMGAYPEGNQGLFEITGLDADRGRFKPPSLRNVALTAPYMHDGSLTTLDDVLDHYAAGGTVTPEGGDGRLNPNKSIFVRGFTLTDEDREALLASPCVNFTRVRVPARG